MPRLRRVPLASLLLVLLLALGSCGGVTDSDQTDEMNGLIDQANALVYEYDALDAEMTELLRKVVGIYPESKAAADALPMLVDADAGLGEMAAKMESAATLWDEASKLDIDEAFRTYCGQQKEIVEQYLQVCAVWKEWVGKLKVMYDPSQQRKLSKAGRRELALEVMGLSDESNELLSRIGEMEQASEKYYSDNGLGE